MLGHVTQLYSFLRLNNIPESVSERDTHLSVSLGVGVGVGRDGGGRLDEGHVHPVPLGTALGAPRPNCSLEGLPLCWQVSGSRGGAGGGGGPSPGL